MLIVNRLLAFVLLAFVCLQSSHGRERERWRIVIEFEPARGRPTARDRWDLVCQDAEWAVRQMGPMKRCGLEGSIDGKWPDGGKVRSEKQE